MITLVVTDGLGNQMFQYAAARSLAKRLNVPLALDLRFYDQVNDGTSRGFWLDRMPIKASIIRYKENGPFQINTAIKRLRRSRRFNRLIQKMSIGPSPRLYRSPTLSFDPHFFECPDNTTIQGFFQSYRYQWPRDQEMLDELDISVFRTNDVSNCLARIRQRCPISIHVRRGDYIGNPNLEINNLGNYISHAMDYCSAQIPNASFLVFSDDENWCRESGLFSRNCKIHVSPQNSVGATDMYLMSQCAHHIIANSTFSWWAAWWGYQREKIVVGPKTWVFGKTSKELEMYPPSWISL